jgi:hypothetical protein
VALGLHDKHAIVPGGSRGIGKAIARELAREVSMWRSWPGTRRIWRRRRESWRPRRTGASFPLQPMSPARSRWTALSRQPIFRAFHVVEVLDHLVLKPKTIRVDNGPLSKRCPV